MMKQTASGSIVLGVLGCGLFALCLYGKPQPEGTMMPTILADVRTILFYGDSLTDGSSYPDYVVNTLNRVFSDARFNILNAAVAGNTAADLRKRLEADVLAQSPDLVTICIGTNDAHGRRPVADFRSDLEAIADALSEADIRVMLIRPSPFGDGDMEARFQAYLKVIDEIAAAYDFPVADAHGLFLEWLKEGKEPLGPDGIHHGKDGFECMARAVLNGFGLDGVKMNMTVTPWPGLLTAWETSAPVLRDGDYDPSEAKGWQPYDAERLSAAQPWWNSPFAMRGAWMPFKDAHQKQVAYGRTYFDAADAGEHELQVGGSPAPQIIWLNGEKVWESGRPHGYHPNADRLTVYMKKGRNEIIGISNFMLFVGVRETKTTQ